jgi:hypothetical protein
LLILLNIDVIDQDKEAKNSSRIWIGLRCLRFLKCHYIIM